MKQKVKTVLLACCAGLILAVALLQVQVIKQSTAYEYAYADVHRYLVLADERLMAITAPPQLMDVHDLEVLASATAQLDSAYGMIRGMYKIVQLTWSPWRVKNFSAISDLEWEIGEVQRAMQMFGNQSDPLPNKQVKFLFDYEKSRLHSLVTAGEASRLSTGRYNLAKLSTQHYYFMRAPATD